MIWVGRENSELSFLSNDPQQYVIHFYIGSEERDNFPHILVENYSDHSSVVNE